jgi:PHD/YefM family antitoxin component YafN of YafNO toxin-antitoxin module
MKPMAVEVNPELADAIKKALESGQYVLFTRGGRKVAYVLPAQTYDEEDLGYMTDPEFWKAIAERREGEDSISLEKVESTLKSPAKRAATRVPKNSEKA